jgi:hypothetical protein
MMTGGGAREGIRETKPVKGQGNLSRTLGSSSDPALPRSYSVLHLSRAKSVFFRELMSG